MERWLGWGELPERPISSVSPELRAGTSVIEQIGIACPEFRTVGNLD